MQIGATQTRTTNPHDNVEGAGDLWFVNIFDFRSFLILVQTDCFHMYSSMGSSSGPTKREPGRPHSRKKSPVVRHKVTLTSLPAWINALLRRLARAIFSRVNFEPLLCARRGASR